MGIDVDVSGYCDICHGDIYDEYEVNAVCNECFHKITSQNVESYCHPINLGIRDAVLNATVSEYLCQHNHSSYLWIGNVSPDYCPNCGRKVQK